MGRLVDGRWGVRYILRIDGSVQNKQRSRVLASDLGCFLIAFCLFAGRSPLDRILPGTSAADGSLLVCLLLATLVLLLPELLAGSGRGLWGIRVAAPFLSLLLVILLGALTSDGEAASISKLIWVGGVNGLLFSLSLYLTSMRRVTWFLLGAVSCSAGLALVAQIQQFHSPLAASRFAALGGGPNVFGRFMVLGAIAAYTLAQGSRLTAKIVLGSLGVLCLVMAVLSGSRGVFVSLVATLLVHLGKALAVLPGHRRLKHGLGIAVIVIGCATLALATASPAARNRLLTGLLEDGPGGQAVSARLGGWQLAFRMFLEKPILGWELGSFGQVSYLEYPHNLYLEIMSETGTLGLLCVAWMTYRLAREVKRSPSPTGVGWSMILCTLFILGAAQFSGDLYDSRLFFFYSGLESTITARQLCSPFTQSSKVAQSRVGGYQVCETVHR